MRVPAATDAHVTAAGSLAPGQWLGRYQLVRRIGVGGMAELYLARAPTGIAGLSRLVALKRILPQLSADDEFVDMFESEARLSALLRHPNIATLHEFVHLGDELFFTMEYVHGADLRAVLRRAASAGRGFRLSHALSIVTRAAAGLHHAHQQRSAAGEDLAIVHRDVSPTNIVVAYDGSVKVIDFGIAKALTRRTSTRTGHVRGKVGYLSPEQAIGAPLDRRSDIFSLAVVLYELTTGRRMFKGKDDYAVVYQLAHGDLPRPSAARSDYDPQLERILMRALSRDRERRYDSAQAFQEALEDYARDHKLSLSSLGVARFMHGLYGDVPDPSHQPGAVNSSAAAASQDAAAERDATDSSLSRSLDRTAPRASRRRQLWALAAAAAAASIGVGAYRGRGKVDSSGTAAVA
ncbi:MAG TPA: serine/threonine protein kinase, partial [Sorangium sp.]|nr:serine/threonine protein kinase [Sorangium sp.]